MFDLVVLGGGPAGYVAAIRAAKFGMSVALIESGELGGTCLNRGCIPTKALLRSAEVYASREEWAGLGISAENVSFDQSVAYARKDSVVSALRGGVAKLLSTLGIKVVNGRGRLAGSGAVEVAGERIEGKNILIATGSRPARLNVAGAEYALTSDEVLSAPIDSDDIVIIGGGVIGCELACYLSDAGKRVHIVEYASKILPNFSNEISVQLAGALTRRGVKITTSAAVCGIGADYVEFDSTKGRERIDCGAVIMATGRRANVEDIGLESIGLPQEKIAVDGNMMTAVKGVYAAGDVTGGIQLAHYASACAQKAVAHMCGRECDIDLTVVPSLVYTRPEVAQVGRTEGAASTGKFLLGANGRSLINGSNRGFIKVFCDDKGVVVGAELFGSGVTELVGELALAVSRRLTAQQVADVIHAHPTVYESVAEACEDVFGLATHKR